VPLNTAYQLKYPLNWQPLLETTGLGYFQVQSHITPQGARAEALLADKTYISTAKSPAPYPVRKCHTVLKGPGINTGVCVTTCVSCCDSEAAVGLGVMTLSGGFVLCCVVTHACAGRF
jgi:hypothetical protein